MNFSDLMNIASERQQATKFKVNKKSKDGESGQVSSNAVKAFLAKRNAEKTKQKEQEEAARRARIQARLQQEQTQKSKNKKKPDTVKNCNSQTNHTPGGQTLKNRTKQEIGEKKRFAHERKLVDNKEMEKRRQEKKGLNRHRHAESKGMVKEKGVKRLEKTGVSGKKDFDSKDNGKWKAEEKNVEELAKKHDLQKPLSKVKKTAPPALSFEQLMSVAKQQANNPDAVRNLMMSRQLKEETKAKVKVKEEAPKTPKTEKKVEKLKRKDSRKGLPTTSKVSKETTEKRGSASISKKKANSSSAILDRKLPKKPEPEMKRKVSEKPKKMTIERETISQKVDRSSPLKRSMIPYGASRDQRKRQYDDYLANDNDDDYDEDMDDFIDDSEAGPDISSYIQEIFGYDREKFQGRDEDIDDMESSFADIQREEAKSARIAKLEDEIEKLKETYELERQMKKKKKLKR